jgi:hypothetical protein
LKSSHYENPFSAIKRFELGATGLCGSTPTPMRRSHYAREYGAERMAQCGAVTFIQRFGSALNLHLHLHMIAIDGVYAADDEGHPQFQALLAPENEEIARLVAGAQELLRDPADFCLKRVAAPRILILLICGVPCDKFTPKVRKQFAKVSAGTPALAAATSAGSGGSSTAIASRTDRIFASHQSRR